jgi:hypothetical protein
VFSVSGSFFAGLHLYIVTRKERIWTRKFFNGKKITEKLKRLFPCGYLPDIVSDADWKKAFINEYKRPHKYFKNSARKIIYATFSRGHLVDVSDKPSDNEEKQGETSNEWT